MINNDFEKFGVPSNFVDYKEKIKDNEKDGSDRNNKDDKLNRNNRNNGLGKLDGLEELSI